jgi:hypothetical protein
MPDDLPIGPAAGESAGPGQAGRNHNEDKRRRRRGPEGEVRGGHEQVPERPLEQMRRDERESGRRNRGSG